MSLKVYMYKVDVELAVLASSDEEAQAKLDNGQVTQVSIDKKLISSTDILVD